MRPAICMFVILKCHELPLLSLSLSCSTDEDDGDDEDEDEGDEVERGRSFICLVIE